MGTGSICGSYSLDGARLFVPVDLAITGLVDDVALENGPRRRQPTARWRSAASKD
jgi:hypothetical protein